MVKTLSLGSNRSSESIDKDPVDSEYVLLFIDVFTLPIQLHLIFLL